MCFAGTTGEQRGWGGVLSEPVVHLLHCTSCCGCCWHRCGVLQGSWAPCCGPVSDSDPPCSTSTTKPCPSLQGAGLPALPHRHQQPGYGTNHPPVLQVRQPNYDASAMCSSQPLATKTCCCLHVGKGTAAAAAPATAQAIAMPATPALASTCCRLVKLERLLDDACRWAAAFHQRGLQPCTAFTAISKQRLQR